MTENNGSDRATPGQKIDDFLERFTLYMDVMALFHELVNYIYDGLDLLEGDKQQEVVAAFGGLIIQKAADEMLQMLSKENRNVVPSGVIFGWAQESLKGVNYAE